MFPCFLRDYIIHQAEIFFKAFWGIRQDVQLPVITPALARDARNAMFDLCSRNVSLPSFHFSTVSRVPNMPLTCPCFSK